MRTELHWIADCLQDQLSKIDKILEGSPVKKPEMLASVAALLRGAIYLLGKVTQSYDADEREK